jgi:hypothetical protein
MSLRSTETFRVNVPGPANFFLGQELQALPEYYFGILPISKPPFITSPSTLMSEDINIDLPYPIIQTYWN